MGEKTLRLVVNYEARVISTHAYSDRILFELEDGTGKANHVQIPRPFPGGLECGETVQVTVAAVVDD